ncbi:MAG: WD40 repeat domain-containing protein [Gemmatimonadota bacterium]|nr:WD40 repeat domain-containing protein [Gemmatimonadota bacterium]
MNGRKDHLGDPLPDRAVQRLGTRRMRGSVTDVAYSADGRRAFVIGGQHLCVWDLIEGSRIENHRMSDHRLAAATWSRDVSRALIADGAGVVREWRLDGNTRESGRFETGRTSLVSLRYSPDEDRVLTLDRETSTVEEWDRATGGRRIAISNAGEHFNLCLYGPDGLTALVAHQPGNNVYHYDLATGVLLKVFVEDYVCYDMCLSADGERLLVGTRHMSNEWRLRDYECLETFTGHLGHAVPSVAYARDERQVLTGSRDGSIRLWDRHAATVIRRWYPHQNHVNRIRVSPDGDWVLSHGGDGLLAETGMATGRPRLQWERHMAGVRALVVSADGSSAISGSTDKTIRWWETEGWTAAQTVECPGGEVHALAVSSDGALVAAGCKDGSVRVFECASGKSVRALEGHRGYVRAVAFAGAAEVVSAADDGSVRVWDAVSGRPLRTLEGHLGGVLALAVSADARQLVSGGRDGALRVWHPATGELDAMVAAHRGWVQSVALKPDGRVISAGRDGWVVEWDMMDGREVRSYVHGDGVEDVLYLSDAGSICLAGQDGRVAVWQPGHAAPEAEFKGHEGAVHALAATPDGRLLLSGSADTTVLVWSLTGLPQ